MSAPGTERAYAAKAVEAVVIDGRTIDWILSNRPNWTETALERELLFGVLRHYFSLRNFCIQYLDKPLRDKDFDLLGLMLVGAYQLKTSDKKVHAIVHETVAGAERLHKKWAKGLINAILRRMQKNEDSLEELDRSIGNLTYADSSDIKSRQEQNTKSKYVFHQYNHPMWLASCLVKQYKLSKQLMLANNSRAPMCLRVNTSKISRDAYTDILDERSIGFKLGLAATSVVLDEPRTSESLPGWHEGHIAIQDLGAQCATEVLLNMSGSPVTRILDACAAPAGKLAHLMESTHSQQVEIQAVEFSTSRLKQSQAILSRLGHQQEILLGDASQDDWWDQKAYSHILLDAPCSGTGTLRRHPDIKVLAQLDNIAMQAQLQGQILNNLWRMLAPGGTLLYCTCSLLEAENDNVVESFLEHQNKNANVLKIKLATGQATRVGWQMLPTDPNTDGFYYALLSKAVSPGHAQQ